MLKQLLALAVVFNACSVDASARDPKARAAFQRLYHCPATGKPRGPCPGYVIDHVIPLACGGADDPLNMQWQTTAEAKAKDRVERIGCGR